MKQYKTMMKRAQFALIATVPFILSSCNDVRNALGLDHYRSDEWSVPNSPPLELPPDYHLLPPKPGADPIRASSPTTQAQKQLGAPSTQNTSNEMEKAIVEKGSGKISANPDIRTQVDKEAANDQTALGKLSNLAKEAKDNIMLNRNPNAKPASAPVSVPEGSADVSKSTQISEKN